MWKVAMAVTTYPSWQRGRHDLGVGGVDDRSSQHLRA